MLRHIFLASLILLAALLPKQANAQDLVLDLDPARSSVDFTLGAFLHTVHGSFKFKSGTLRLDPATGKAQGEFDVDLTTGATGIGARDAVMQGHVLETQRFPDAVFTADAVSGQLNATGTSTLDIHGQLAIHGAIHDLTFHVTAVADGTQVTVTSGATIPYAQWGMKNPSTFLLHVNDHVEVNVRAVAEVHPAR
jgi:polyisoprenoid-binding protein YceI